jgi:hypothetical protein
MQCTHSAVLIERWLVLHSRTTIIIVIIIIIIIDSGSWPAAWSAISQSALQGAQSKHLVTPLNCVPRPGPTTDGGQEPALQRHHPRLRTPTPTMPAHAPAHVPAFLLRAGQSGAGCSPSMEGVCCSAGETTHQ